VTPSTDDVVGRYFGDRDRAGSRPSSFDYCFNYFRSHREKGDLARLLAPGQLETSCLQLGFYLASWGMYWGSLSLPRYSVRCYEPVLEAVVASPATAWELDVDGYSDDGVEQLLELAARIREALPDAPTPTLVTKTLLGIFGCVPAFDTYFREGFRKRGTRIGRLDGRSLRAVAGFYSDNHDLVERCRIRTLDFATGQQTERRYTRAKAIDMILFGEGWGSWRKG
jgi:hypothetical protein